MQSTQKIVVLQKYFLRLTHVYILVIRGKQYMKPRDPNYRILARCKAAKHGKTEKAKRKQENEKVAKELADKHDKRSLAMSHAYRLLYSSDW